jgi:hypothetical protein
MEGAVNANKWRGAEGRVQAWNEAHQVGASVRLHRDDGEVVDTRTRSQAYIAASGVAVIHLEGIRGYYLLERVQPRPEVFNE